MSSDNNNNENENIIKNKTSNSSPSSNLLNSTLNFCLTTFINLLAIVIQFILGGMVLFGCKLGQSNILPTDIKSFPYTETQPEIQPINTNIFTSYDPKGSLKLSFPYKNDQLGINNSKHMLIDILRNEKKETKSNVINFFISLIDGLFSFNYSSMNMALQLINYLPEFLIIFFGPLILFVFCIILLIFNNFYLIYLWISNLSWFFKTKQDATWVNVTKYTEYVWSFFMASLFFILMWILLIFVAPFSFVSFFIFMWSFISIFTYTGIMNNQAVKISSILIDVFKYYKVTFMSIFSFFLVLNAFVTFGTLTGIFFLFTILLIIFNIIKIDVFKPVPKENLSEFVSTERAKRTKIVSNPSSSSPMSSINQATGFLNNMFDNPKTMLSGLKKLNTNLYP
jgi:hypothetical protein